MRVEPPPSVATASGAMPLATATAAPPLEPPLVRSACQALRVRPNSGESVRHLEPNSGVVVLPTRIAPCMRNRATATASSAGTLSRIGTAPKVVRTPRVLTMSLAVKGMPCSGGSGRPDITSASAARAAAMASSAHSVIKQFSTGCSRSARASTAAVSSTGEISLRRMRCCSAAALARQSASLIGRASPEDGRACRLRRAQA